MCGDGIIWKVFLVCIIVDISSKRQVISLILLSEEKPVWMKSALKDVEGHMQCNKNFLVLAEEEEEGADLT